MNGNASSSEDRRHRLGVALPGSAGDHPGRNGYQEAVEASRIRESQQDSIIGDRFLEQSYLQALSANMAGKEDQVGRLAEKIESLIESQEARIQQGIARQPGPLSLPATRRAWRLKQDRMSSRLQSLHHRLDWVQDIQTEMGVHASRIEDMAAQKVQFRDPRLVLDWRELKEEQRRNNLGSGRGESTQKEERAFRQRLGGGRMGMD